VVTSLCPLLLNSENTALKTTSREWTSNTSVWMGNNTIKVKKYSSPNIVRVIKSRRMRGAGHVARMDEERGCIGSWWGNRRERDQWGDLGVDGWIILGWISRRWDVGIWTGLGWPRIDRWRTLVSVVMNFRVP